MICPSKRLPKSIDNPRSRTGINEHNAVLSDHLLSLIVAHLCGVGGSNGLGNTSDLATSTNDLLASSVANERDVLVLSLCLLPDLDLTTASEDTNTHRGEEVVCGVGVIVNTTVEDGSGIFANS